MLNSIQISELLCTKLCHDLAGPIGAINNGIDFFDSENKQMQDKALELVKLSSKQAVNRLTYYRQAYGTVGEDTEMHLAEIKSLAMKYIEDTKLSLDFSEMLVDESDAINSRAGKILLNVLIIATGIIMNNGLISITIDTLNEKIKFRVCVEAAVFKLEEELKNILLDNMETVVINSRNIQQYYTTMLIKEMAGNVNFLEEDGKVTMLVTCNKSH